MEAPKLRGMFRNVRTKPRTFVFKSRHLPDGRPEWDERKRRIDAEIAKEKGEEIPESDRLSDIRFRRSSGAAKDSVRKNARRANLRVVLIAVVLVYVAYRILIWTEKTEFGEMLEFIRDNG
jgi:hypothetical protein|tara:strand:- start:229 stop:591 length:363 start_codon:yes stop_codon:yes gene_type:complete